MAGRRAALAGALVLVAALAPVAAAGGTGGEGGPGAARQAGTAAAVLERTPLALTPNAGQVDRRVRYVAHAPGASLFFARRHIALALGGPGRRGAALRLRFVGADPDVRLHASGRAPGRTNVLRGERRSWRRGLPTWRTVTYEGLWPGIDLVVQGAGSSLRTTFRVAPGADSGAIRLAYDGARAVRRAADGGLEVVTAAGTLRAAAPTGRQGRARVAARPRVAADGRTHGLALGAHDPARAVLLEPQLEWSTFLGRAGGDLGVTEEGWGVAVGADGSTYVTGQAVLGGYPTTPGAFDETFTGWTDAFVSKIDPSGSQLVWSTVVGGTGPTLEEVQECQFGSVSGRRSDAGLAIAVDRSGSAYLTGRTDADDFPVTAGAHDTTRNGTGCDVDAFVAKLAPAGDDLEWSTFLGGTQDDEGEGIAVDRLGQAHVTGVTGSTGFPTTEGAHDGSLGGDGDAFVATLSPSGARLVASTLLGGAASDRGAAVALAGEDVVVTGTTRSTDFPTRRAFDATLDGARDAFVARLGRRASRLRSATYLGGAGDEAGADVAVDALGRTAVTGPTDSPGFPVTPAAFDASYNGSGDAFVSVLGRSGATLVTSTFLGGADVDSASAIALDRRSRPVVVGATGSADFPVTPGALDGTLGGGPTPFPRADAFVTRLETDGAGLVASTYLGGTETDLANDVAVDRSGAAHVTGATESPDFPTTPGAVDSTFNEGPGPVGFGLFDVFVSKLAAP